MKIKEIRKSDRPREKAKEYGISYLSELELMAIILGSGYQKSSAIDIANEILKMLDERSDLTLLDLLEIPGVGEVKALTILATLELARRLNVKKKKDLHFDNPQGLYRYLKSKYKNDKEHFIVLYFNKIGKYITELASTNDNYNSVSFNSKEIARKALKIDAYFIVIAHNHPSNNSRPSKTDIETTENLKHKLFLLNIILLDHIIFSDYNYYSFLENKKM